MKKRFPTNNRQKKLDLEEQEDECRERLKQELEDQKEKWVERQQRKIERKIAQLPNPKHREQLLAEEQQAYEERKKKFDLSFEDARKSLVGNPTTRIQVRIGLIQNGCLVSETGLMW